MIDMYINIYDGTLKGCMEYKQTGDISVETNKEALLFADDLEVLDTIPFEYDFLYPQNLRTVGYADLGEDHTTLIFMYGTNDNHGTEIASIDDNYFLECFQSGMTRDEIKEELTEMIMQEFANCDGIHLDDIDIKELEDSMDHPIGIVDKYLNNGEFEKSEKAITHNNEER